MQTTTKTLVESSSVRPRVLDGRMERSSGGADCRGGGINSECAVIVIKSLKSNAEHSRSFRAEHVRQDMCS